MDKNYQILSVEQEKDFLLKHLSEVIKREEEKDEFEGIDRVTYTITLFKNKTEDYNYNQTILFKYDSSIELKVVKDKGNASYFLNGFCFRCFGSTSVLGADGILLQLSDEAKLHYGEAVQITFLTGDKKRIETENYK